MTIKSTPPSGVYPDVPFSEYLEWDAISSHDLMKMMRSPAHYRYSKDAQRGEPSAAMRLGTAVHAYILEENDVSDDVAVLPPDINRRTKAGKEDYAIFCADNSSRTILTLDEHQKASNMADTVFACRAAQVTLDAAPHREHSLLWECPTSGLAARGRPDAYGPDHNIVVDIKTTADASPHAFAKSVANFKYHVQAFAYMNGLQALGKLDDSCQFIIIAVESSAPYTVGVYALDRSDVELGGQLYAEATAKYMECAHSDVWPGYSEDKIEVLPLPTWARKNYDRNQED